uniref:Uncharacterized protein n=1 Tax=Arundo donax TaxID=35708 RepID=A0A0A9ER72_ARUDO
MVFFCHSSTIDQLKEELSLCRSDLLAKDVQIRRLDEELMKNSAYFGDEEAFVSPVRDHDDVHVQRCSCICKFLIAVLSCCCILFFMTNGL